MTHLIDEIAQDRLVEKRTRMVERQLLSRGITDPAVLKAAGEVPRDIFVPPALVEFAYDDTPLPIEEEQTISQPYIVALMAEMMEIEPGDRVLEVGTGSGYAAAVLSELASEVYTIERHESLADGARQRLQAAGYDNVFVRHGDGSQGWPEAAPFDAIVVAAGGPEIPIPLQEQLAVGGRLVIPVGSTPRSQELIRLRRTSANKYEKEYLGPVRFVPLVGEAGWQEGDGRLLRQPVRQVPQELSQKIAAAAEPFSQIAGLPLDKLMQRIGDARVVLLGEASHGTAEFYDVRAEITKALIKRKDFNIIAVEADWPDARAIDHYIRDGQYAPPDARPFTRFPTWMWANESVMTFIKWLRDYNSETSDPSASVGFYGLDLYSLNTSINAVLQYLEDVDPDTAAVARLRYGCFSPWETDPATYGAAAMSGKYEDCEPEVVAMLQDLLDSRLRYTADDGQRFMDAVQNARLIANAEKYYRLMYYGSAASWNLRDQHMFATLEQLLNFRGLDAKAVVWAHNSHVGDARATEMGRVRQEFNVGQLTREAFEDRSYMIGFGTDHGTVAAASTWGGPMEVKQVRPSHPRSYERVCHDSKVDRFLLPLRHAATDLRNSLAEERLERAIGVIYRPETELQSHYFYAQLPHQFDEYIWLDETQAVTPIRVGDEAGLPDTFPFGV